MKPLIWYKRKYKSIWTYWDGTKISIQLEKQLKNKKNKFKGGYYEDRRDDI